ncbi:DUF3488 and transglutaminase-like domain-containing protein [Gallaecimonas sp. GXIMD4217]|uniref:transglutaminase TgpA family protein n=1 Tax=Gallaecimonas sp. GXIMD4217 TaxID=3131927 RepID=UPI00311ADDD6
MRWYLPRQILILLVLIQLMAVLPLFSVVGPGLVVLTLACCGWCSAICLGRGGAPPRWLLVALALAGAGLLAVTLPGKGSLVAMVSLLVLGFGLKLLEIKSSRDLHVLVLIGYFLLATDFVHYQSMAMALYLLLAALVNTAILLSLYGKSLSMSFIAREMGRAALLSLPLTLLLFLLTPRLAPLWQMPDARQATTGLSDSMSPGDIAELSRSTELAFRAALSWRPAPDSLYWRALTLEYFDGRAWHQAAWRQREERTPLPRPRGRGRDWQLIMEGSGQRWLPILAGSVSRDGRLMQTTDGRLLSTVPVLKRQQFFLAQGEGRAIDADNLTLRRNLVLPEEGNPRTRRKIQAQVLSLGRGRTLISALMEEFGRAPFRYSLTPPLLGSDSVDDFLFDSRSGFCGHYASALAYQLRLAGIPARIVAGYQGGEYLPEGDFYAVYQYDAHAWVEAWLPESGWLRLDPTARVAPERVEAGFSRGLMQDQAFAGEAGMVMRMRNQGLVRWLRQQAALLDYQWTRWVLNYDGARRSDLLQRLLGRTDILGGGLLFVGALLGLILFFNWWSNRGPRVHQGEATRLYLKACRRLARHGLERRPGETALAFARRVADTRPELAVHFNRISQLYNRLRYQPEGGDKGELERMKRLIGSMPGRR